MPRLRENLGDPLGHTLFPNFSIFAHDCMANCRYTVSKDGRSVMVRALRHIKEGENLNITYTNPLLGNQVCYLMYSNTPRYAPPRYANPTDTPL